MQLALFNPPRARRSDPATSRQAARAVRTKANTDTLAVTRLVDTFPGETSANLADLTDQFDRHTVAKRLPDAEKAGWVRKGASKKSNNGHPGVTWWVTDEGRRVLNG